MDNIPNVALKTAVNAIPETFLDMYNKYMLRRGHLLLAMEAAESSTLAQEQQTTG